MFGVQQPNSSDAIAQHGDRTAARAAPSSSLMPVSQANFALNKNRANERQTAHMNVTTCNGRSQANRRSLKNQHGTVVLTHEGDSRVPPDFGAMPSNFNPANASPNTIAMQNSRSSRGLSKSDLVLTTAESSAQEAQFRYFALLEPLFEMDFYADATEMEKQVEASHIVTQVVSELNSLALRQLSKVHRDELIKRSHQIADLAGFSFFLDIQQSNISAQGPMSQKSMVGGSANAVIQRIGQHLRRQVEKKDSKTNFVPMTRFKYARGQTNYIVVERDFLAQSQAGMKLTRCAAQLDQLGRRLLDDARHFYSSLDANSKNHNSASQQMRGQDYLSQEPLCAFVLDKTYCMFMKICKKMLKEGTLQKLVQESKHVVNQQDSRGTQQNLQSRQGVNGVNNLGKVREQKMSLKNGAGPFIDVAERQGMFNGASKQTVIRGNDNHQKSLIGDINFAHSQQRSATQRTGQHQRCAKTHLSNMLHAGQYGKNFSRDTHSRLQNGSLMNPVQSKLQLKTQQVRYIRQKIMSQFLQEASKHWIDNDYLLQAYLRYLIRNKRESRWVSQIQNAKTANVKDEYDRTLDIVDELESSKIIGKIIEADDLEYALHFFDSSKEVWHSERRGSLHPEYDKLYAYNRKSTFCLSRFDALPDALNSRSKNRQYRPNAEGDRQVYHTFQKVLRSGVDLDESEDAVQFDAIMRHFEQEGVDPSDYDVHHYNFKAPIGSDPCQTRFQQKMSEMMVEELEKRHKSDKVRAFVKTGCLSEGVFREDLSHIPIPKPQSYHTYCQVCNEMYADFEQHVAQDSHKTRAKNQAHISDIDDVISSMNGEQKWMTEWRDQPLKDQEQRTTNIETVKFLINASAEEIREKWVSHNLQKKIADVMPEMPDLSVFPWVQTKDGKIYNFPREFFLRRKRLPWDAETGSIMVSPKQEGKRSTRPITETAAAVPANIAPTASVKVGSGKVSRTSKRDRSSNKVSVVRSSRPEVKVENDFYKKFKNVNIMELRRSEEIFQATPEVLPTAPVPIIEDEESKVSQHQVADLVTKEIKNTDNVEMCSAQEEEDGVPSEDDSEDEFDDEESSESEDENEEDSDEDVNYRKLLHLTEAPRKIETVAEPTQRTNVQQIEEEVEEDSNKYGSDTEEEILRMVRDNLEDDQCHLGSIISNPQPTPEAIELNEKVVEEQPQRAETFDLESIQTLKAKVDEEVERRKRMLALAPEENRNDAVIVEVADEQIDSSVIKSLLASNDEDVVSMSGPVATATKYRPTPFKKRRRHSSDLEEQLHLQKSKSQDGFFRADKDRILEPESGCVQIDAEHFINNVAQPEFSDNVNVIQVDANNMTDSVQIASQSNFTSRQLRLSNKQPDIMDQQALGGQISSPLVIPSGITQVQAREKSTKDQSSTFVQVTHVVPAVKKVAEKADQLHATEQTRYRVSAMFKGSREQMHGISPIHQQPVIHVGDKASQQPIDAYPKKQMLNPYLPAGTQQSSSINMSRARAVSQQPKLPSRQNQQNNDLSYLFKTNTKKGNSNRRFNNVGLQTINQRNVVSKNTAAHQPSRASLNSSSNAYQHHHGPHVTSKASPATLMTARAQSGGRQHMALQQQRTAPVVGQSKKRSYEQFSSVNNGRATDLDNISRSSNNAAGSKRMRLEEAYPYALKNQQRPSHKLHMDGRQALHLNQNDRPVPKNIGGTSQHRWQNQQQ